MDGLKASFEKELKNKLQQKSSGVTSEEAILTKAFKYFDLNNSGTVDPEEFAKAIEKIGIMIPTKQDLDMLFGLYDVDNSGDLTYKEFSAAIFDRPATADSSVNRQARTAEDLAEVLKQKLVSRGSRGFIGLQRQFKIMDDNNSRSLDKYEFTKAMTDYMLGFTEGEIQKLFGYFDVDRSGDIQFDEFIRAIRGEMNQQRKKVVARCFKKLDKDSSGWIDISDIRGVYVANKHPDVISGKKTEDQILQEFLETFETAHSMRNNEAPNYVVTKDEFDEYYNNISASIDDDAYFEQMMISAWKLDAVNAPKQQQRPQDNDIFGTAARRTAAPAEEKDLDLNATETQVLEQIQKKIASRGARGIQGIQRQFKIADDNNSKSLDLDEFGKAMHDFRCGLSAKQIITAFGIFDRDGSGEISFDEFLRAIRGEMNDVRKALCMKAYKIMDSDGSGQLDINDIRQTYNAKQHPDVKSGKKTEDEILGEFLDTFENHFCSMKGHEDARDGKISHEEWLEYYNNVSMSIDKDEYFLAMMNSAWNLDSSKVTKKGWAGEQ